MIGKLMRQEEINAPNERSVEEEGAVVAKGRSGNSVASSSKVEGGHLRFGDTLF